MARIDPMADASLPDIRARSRPGTAIAAMIPIIATTISSSIRVKPSFFCILFTINLLEALGPKPGGSLLHRRFVHGALSYGRAEIQRRFQTEPPSTKILKCLGCYKLQTADAQ